MNKPQFVLNIHRSDSDMAVRHSKMIRGETLTELLSKLPLIIHELERDLHEEQIEKFKVKMFDDEIPF
jgi:hypothetical protein